MAGSIELKKETEATGLLLQTDRFARGGVFPTVVLFPSFSRRSCSTKKQLARDRTRIKPCIFSLGNDSSSLPSCLHPFRIPPFPELLRKARSCSDAKDEQTTGGKSTL